MLALGSFAGRGMENPIPRRATSMAVETPEVRLMVTVLDAAIGDLLRYADARDARGRARFAELVDWFLSENSDPPFSFVGVCDALGLDASHVRECLVRDPRAARFHAAPASAMAALPPVTAETHAAEQSCTPRRVRPPSP